MPSLLIHLAIAKRYVELHPNRITNLNDFCKGSIAPDLNDDFSKMLSKPEKLITHYYFTSEDRTNFTMFKQDKRVNLSNDYWKGYYAHLLSDDLFYLTYFKQESDQSIKDNTNLYDDFTILTSNLIKDYHPKLDSAYITDTIRHILTTTKNGKCKYLDYPKVQNFIEKVSTNLDDYFI